jgi:hypothetical protein
MTPQHFTPYESALATLVQQDAKPIGMVSRYDLLQQLIGTR